MTAPFDPLPMQTTASARRPLFGRRPDGHATLEVRWRYLRRRRLIGDRGWTTLWVTAMAVIGWLFIAGFAGLGH